MHERNIHETTPRKHNTSQYRAISHARWAADLCNSHSTEYTNFPGFLFANCILQGKKWLHAFNCFWIQQITWLFTCKALATINSVYNSRITKINGENIQNLSNLASALTMKDLMHQSSSSNTQHSSVIRLKAIKFQPITVTIHHGVHFILLKIMY